VRSYNKNFVADGTKPRNGSRPLPEPLRIQDQTIRDWQFFPLSHQGVSGIGLEMKLEDGS